MDNLNKTYKFIESFIEENGYSPSVRELCTGLGFNSTSTAQYYLKKLREQGLISETNLKKRSITLTEKNKRKAVYVPEIGKVTAGQPILAVENLVGYLPLPEEFSTADDVFALTVEGTSMINAGILNGDKIIVKKCNTANNGDIVVALIDDSATVKRFFKKEDKFILHPENDAMEDIVLNEVYILGLVVGLIRKF